MAKVTISRLFEISKYLATKSGKELEDAFRYLSIFIEVTVRNLKNGLTFFDNFFCEIKQVSVQSGVETIVLPSNKTVVMQILVRRVIDDVYYVISDFGWNYDKNGNLIVKTTFAGSPPANTNISIELLIFFG